MPNESPGEGWKAMETSCLNDGLKFGPLPNGFHFVRVSGDFLSGHNEPQKANLRLEEDVLL